MQLSIHYYVLSLSDQLSILYEAFRDKLISIQNSNFPFESFIHADHSDNQAFRNSQLKEFFRQTDQHFIHYYDQDPLYLVVVGEKNNLSIFETLITHRDALIGHIEGNYIITSPHDLGKIVWPVIKEAISGSNNNALRELTKAAEASNVVSGIDAVGQSAETETGPMLYVEEDYHVKGSLRKVDQTTIVRSKHVELWDVIDDVVDIIIEKVLEMGGTVIFMKNDSLKNHERIALVPSS